MRAANSWGPAFILAAIIHIAGLAVVGQGVLGETDLEPKKEYLEVELAPAMSAEESKRYQPAAVVPAVGPSSKATNNVVNAGVAPVTPGFAAAGDGNVAAPITAAVPNGGQVVEVSGGNSGIAAGNGEAVNGGTGNTETGSGFASVQPSADQEVDSRAYAVYKPKPVYPSEARLNHWEGRVIVRVLVDASGHVADARVAQSSGYAELDQAAVEGVYRWRYKPAYRAGRPVSESRNALVNFDLD
ncbi:MAG: hypothetical protein H6Q72_4250 [Firmicutes bacterium]|nr:hypothetical protein [Bacillota bacterium]